MNKFKKFLIGLMIAAAAACLGGVAACNGSDGNTGSNPTDPPAYYQLDLKGSGIDIVFDGELAETDDKGESFRFGGTVKEGVEVRFKVLLGANTTGTPVISVNQTLLTPDADGFYSFIMEKNSEISVTGLNALHTLKFSRFEEVIGSDGNGRLEERRVKFFDETGTRELDEEVTVTGGEDFKFRIWTSPYYNDEFTVSCGFEELVKDDKGVYTVQEVGESGEVSVTGLTLQESFANFEDGRYGDGTAEHPYELRKPVDLYYLAAIIDDDYYGGRFASLNYKLMKDIDMDGEQLFVIGDNSTSYSAFCGTFDGGGHTIKNFRITDEVYDQSTYELEYLPYVGLFGYAVATVNSNNEIVAPVIKNLTLEDYSVEIHTASSGAGAYAGSLLGYGIGVEISGCKAISGTGSITVINDNNQLVNVGGLVGRLQGAYGSTSQGTVSHGAFVRSSSAVVSMHGTGCPRAAGGIVGYLISAEESAIAYVVDCYSKGSVNGAMHSGGIVGTLGRFSTVTNCYSSAEVSADNRLGGVNVTNEYKGAYAGGIVGYAEENTVIAGCYAANYTSASVNSFSAYSVNGAAFMSTGAFAGDYAKPNSNADQIIKFSTDYDVLVEYNNATAVAGHPKSVFTSLGWVDSEWSYSGALPEIVLAGAAREIKIKIEQYNNPAFSRSFSLSEVAPLSDWYKRQGGLPEYHENSVGRSWGYYFDKEMTKKAPYGFVPVMAETTLYAGYADYAEVEGIYYVGETAYTNGAYIELTIGGIAKVRNGGMYHECAYAYTGAANGSKIILYRSGLASLSYGEDEINGGYFAYGGTAVNGVLSLSAYLTLVNPSGSTETGDYYVNETASLNAVKASESFVYGEYKDANGVRYQFNKNGSGLKVNDKSTTAFTFVPAGNSFSITLDKAVTVTVGGDGTVDTIDEVPVSKIDEFKGSWKKTANGLTEFTFDGEGFVSLNGGEAVEYKPADGGVGFEIGNVEYKATFANGALVINGENYYKNDGFTGEWFMLGSKEQIQVAFDGIGTDGYGTAVISYSGGESQTVEAEYDVVDLSDGRYLRIYVGDRQYGELLFNTQQKSASGSFYSWLYERYDAYTFYLYDLFRGSWTAAGDDFDTVTFNGRSASADDSEVAVRTAGNVPTSGRYTLTDSTHGTMTVGGRTYTLVYDGATNLITFSYKAEGETTVDRQLGRRDGWYGVELTDGTLTYKFDGKSNVGGKVEVNDADKTKLDYSISGGVVTMGEYTLTPGNDGFDWNGQTLKFNTGFAGDWLISGVDNVLTIKEVGGYMTAEVSATGAEGKPGFVFDPAAKTLTLTEGETVTLIKLMGENEMSITRTSSDGNKYYNCLKSDMADSWKGVYSAEDGSSWKFDGLGNCRYGGGTAVYTPASGDPVRYGYRINELGIPYIRATENVVFVEDSEGAYVSGDKNYKTVTVNSYYGRRVFTENAGARTTYLFDGVSTLWERHTDGSYTAAYTYEIVTSTGAELIKNGVRYNGLMEEAGMSIRLTISEQLRATSGGTTYAFGVRTLWTVGSDGSYTKAYTFILTDEKNREYELTDAAGAKFDAKLIENEDKSVSIIIAPKEDEEDKTEQA